MDQEADEIVQDVLSKLWEGVASGDPLRAELETATCMAFPYVLGQRDSADIESFIATVLVKGAVRRRTPDGAALLRLLMTLGTAATRRAASRALAELTGEGIYPPEWVTEIGKAAPGQAWRRYDVFGDDEAIAVTFSYGEAEHGIVVQVDLAGIPVGTTIGVSSSAAKLIEAISGNNEEFDRSEQISLAEARVRMLRPLDRAGRDESPKLSPSSIAYLPVARSRVRRLPEGDGGLRTVFTAADRAAAGEGVIASPGAAAAVAAGEAATRFLAAVLTGSAGSRKATAVSGRCSRRPTARPRSKSSWRARRRPRPSRRTRRRPGSGPRCSPAIAGGSPASRRTRWARASSRTSCSATCRTPSS